GCSTARRSAAVDVIGKALAEGGDVVFDRADVLRLTVHPTRALPGLLERCGRVLARGLRVGLELVDVDLHVGGVRVLDLLVDLRASPVDALLPAELPTGDHQSDASDHGNDDLGPVHRYFAFDRAEPASATTAFARATASTGVPAPPAVGTS